MNSDETVNHVDDKQISSIFQHPPCFHEMVWQESKTLDLRLYER